MDTNGEEVDVVSDGEEIDVVSDVESKKNDPLQKEASPEKSGDSTIPESKNDMSVDETSDDDIAIVSFAVQGKQVSPEQFDKRTVIPPQFGTPTKSRSVECKAEPVDKSEPSDKPKEEPVESKTESPPGLPDEVLPFIQEKLKRSQNCDVVLIAGTQKVPVHASVLSGYSKYFKRIFSGREMKTDQMFRLPVDIPDPSVLSLLIKNMYSGGNSITIEQAKNLLPATTLFEIDYLSEKCIKILVHEMTPSNCFDMVLLAARSKNEKLQLLAETMIQEDLDFILTSDDFMDLSLDTMIRLIDKDALTVSPHVVNKLVDAWLSHKERRDNTAIFTQLKTIQLFRNDYKHHTSIFDGKPFDFKLETSEHYVPGWVFLSSLITPKAAREAIPPISSANLNILGESIKVKLLDDEENLARLHLPDFGADPRRKRKLPGHIDEPDGKR